MNDLLSCDTMVALGNSTESGRVIFAKNSDRPLGEAQPLCLFEAEDHPAQAALKCTYISIPQVRHTYKVLGSKPYWIWGFEHGMNEWGVAIGNEAVWSREEEECENGLLGMDLVRLGLERARTAHEALHVITDLLKTYGQGGNASVAMDFRYHNAFLIADTCGAWILDTVNRRWVARKVKDAEGISNCYSTGSYWDEDSGDVLEHAYEMGYADRDHPFHFAKAYGAVTPRLRAAYPRYKRLNQMLDRKKGRLTTDYMKNILKDHFEGEIIEPRWSPADGILASICMHNMDESSSKTAAGSVVELRADGDSIWWSCMSNPCISVFLPFSMNTLVPRNISNGGARYSDDSLWWKLERLSYELEEDYPRNTSVWNPVKEALQEHIHSLAQTGLTDSLIREMALELEEKADRMYATLRDINVTGNEPQRRDVVRAARMRAGIPGSLLVR